MEKNENAKTEIVQKVAELNVRYIAQRNDKTNEVQDIEISTMVTVNYTLGNLIFKFDKLGSEYYEILSSAYAQHFLQNDKNFVGYWEKRKKYFKDLPNGEQTEAYFTSRYIISGTLPQEILDAIAYAESLLTDDTDDTQPPF